MYDFRVNNNSHCTNRILQFRAVKNVSGQVLSSRYFFFWLIYFLKLCVIFSTHCLWQTWLNFQIQLRSQLSKRTMSPLINTDETYVNCGLPWNYVLRMVYFGTFLLWFCVRISDCTSHCKLSINYRDYLNTFECKTITSFAQVIECAPTITEKMWDIILLISEAHEGVKLVSRKGLLSAMFVNFNMLVRTWRHSGHVGGQE